MDSVDKPELTITEHLDRYDALALDVDGTSVRNEPVHFDVVRNIVNGYGAITWDWWFKNLGSGQHGIHEKLSHEFPAFQISEHEFVERWKADYCKRLEQDPASGAMIRPGLKPLIEAFKDAGKPVFAVSASERSMVEGNLKAIGVRASLEFALAAEDLRDNNLRPKPYGDSYTFAFNQVGIPPQRVLVAEDTDKGVNAALASGAGGIIGIYYPGTKPHEGATYNVREDQDMVSELKQLIQTFRQQAVAPLWTKDAKAVAGKIISAAISNDTHGLILPRRHTAGSPK